GPSSNAAWTTNSTISATGTFSNSITISPAGIGDLLVAGFSLKNKVGAPSLSGTGGSGWTTQNSVCVNNIEECTYTFTKLVTSTSSQTLTISVNNTTSSNSALLAVFEYSGATNTSVGSATSTGSVNPPTSASVTPSVDNTLLFAVFTQGLGTAY